MRLITPPATLCVPVAAAKAHLRVDHDLDDAQIEDLIRAATEHLDGWSGVLGRALEAQTWELALDAFPAGAIRLPLGPVASVTSIIYADPAGAEQTLDPAAYVLDAQSVEGWVVPLDGWPATAEAVNAVRVRWVAGTGTPRQVRQAILLLVGHWYLHREAVGAAAAELPLGVQTLIAPLRRFNL